MSLAGRAQAAGQRKVAAGHSPQSEVPSRDGIDGFRQTAQVRVPIFVEGHGGATIVKLAIFSSYISPLIIE
jgi:hypothetical protein